MPATAAACVFDGQDDRGLDAMSVEIGSPQPRICLVQAKWSDQGKGGFDEEAVHKMFRGLDLLFDRAYSMFNSRFQPLVPELQKAFEIGTPEGDPGPRADADRASRLRTCSALLRRRSTHRTRSLSRRGHKVLDLRDFHRAILGDAATPKIDTTVRLDGFVQESMPYKALYGTMTAPDLADLYGEHRRGLFARNIRDSLDLTDVNVKIQNTLLEQPEHFWYFSNGITMLCETIKPVGQAVPGKVGDFKLTGASVVNGAQTVSAIAPGVHQGPRHRADRPCHGPADLPGGLPARVRRPGDHHHEHRRTRSRSVTSSRSTRGRSSCATTSPCCCTAATSSSAASESPDPAHGCSIAEAAEALAAVSPNAQLAAVAKRDQNLAGLWEDDVYQEIFGPSPNVYRVWRSVELLRAVRAELQTLRDGLLWRADAAASHGDLLVTHIVFRRLDTTAIERPRLRLGGQSSPRCPQLVQDTLAWVLRAIDDEYGKSSHIIAAVRNTERMQRVVRAAHEGPGLRDYRSRAQRGLPGRGSRAARTAGQRRHHPDRGRPHPRGHGPGVPAVLPAGTARDDGLARREPRAGPRDLANNNGTGTRCDGQADGEWYSPSGLARKMRVEASGVDTSAQGTVRWFVAGEGSLDDLAYEVRQSEGIDVENGPAGD